jgi:predicted glutamine amidotransferase
MLFEASLYAKRASLPFHYKQNAPAYHSIISKTRQLTIPLQAKRASLPFHYKQNAPAYHSIRRRRTNLERTPVKMMTAPANCKKIKL